MEDTTKEQKFVKRDTLIAIEHEMQQEWATAKPFESEPLFDEAGNPKPKFMVTFPYPYMNGRLHLGHAFSLTKAEFAARFQRLMGKNVLFPFSFHCTGMPIQAAANKLARELEEFGNPPDFEQADAESSDQNGKVKKKAAMKSGGATRQYKIMQMMVPEEEIPLFTDPYHWLRHFPPLAKADLQRFGVSVDWRRSFITTIANPFYDRFIQWQFRRLQAAGLVIQGVRPTVYSPLDQQVCADHDRASGEGLNPQEYTLIKLRLQQLTPTMVQHGLEGKDVFVAAATLRPETMYGQTNCFVLPGATYVCGEMANGEVLVVSERAMQNLSFQNYTQGWGEVNILCEVSGDELLGTPLSAPLAKYSTVYLLPLPSISMKKGTGIVTSVPSDAPDDYAMLRDIQTKEKIRETYNISDEMCMPFEPVPVIQIPGYSEMAALDVIEKYHIISHKDKPQLAQAKEEVYTKGFYEGRMIVESEEFNVAGMTVEEAKPLVKKYLIESGQALLYHEPEGLVMSRSGDECVVALCDQFYFPYGKEEWKQKLLDHFHSGSFRSYSKAILTQFEVAVDWLSDWACSRKFGLGTFLPGSNEEWVIESLSDSTIYMAYYTIASLLQGEDNMDGSNPNPLEINIEDVNDTLFDFIFKKDEEEVKATDAYATLVREGSSVTEDKLQQMRRQFQYWYPMDLRVSGKDLIPNHLTMSLYNHAAIWDDQPEMMPRGFYANGHVLVDGNKMSKSTGNFFMLYEACDKFGVDATRFSLSEAGDSLVDANFQLDIVNAATLTLYNEMQWVKEMIETGLITPHSEQQQQEEENQKEDEEKEEYGEWIDQVFENEMKRLANRAAFFFDDMKFREGMQFCAHGMTNMRDFYREWCRLSNKPMNPTLLRTYVENYTIMLSVACPHWSDYVWRKLLGHSTFVSHAKWPYQGENYNVGLSSSLTFIQKQAHEIRQAVDGKKTGTQFSASIQVADEYPASKVAVLHRLKQEYEQFQEEKKESQEDSKASDEEDNGMLPSDIKERIMNWIDTVPELKKEKGILLGFASLAINLVTKEGEDPEQAFETELAFNQMEVLQLNEAFLLTSCNLVSVEVSMFTRPSAEEEQAQQQQQGGENGGGKKKKKKRNKKPQEPEPRSPKVTITALD